MIGLAGSVPAFLLSACASDPNVVAKAVQLPPVSRELTRRIDAPLCDPSVKADYSTEEIEASRQCWKAAFGDAAARHESLSAATRAREKAMGRLAKKGS